MWREVISEINAEVEAKQAAEHSTINCPPPAQKELCRNCAFNIHVGPCEFHGIDATLVCSCGCHDW